MKPGDKIKLLKSIRWAGRPHSAVPAGTVGTLYSFIPIPTRPDSAMLAIKFPHYRPSGNFHFGIQEEDRGTDFEVLP